MPASQVLQSMRRFWQRTYGAEYVGLIILLVTYALLRLFIPPFQRMFSLDDLAISFPFAEHERVTPFLLLFLAGIIPLCLLILWAIIFRPGWHAAHVTILGLVISCVLTVFVTDVIKTAVGRPRPDLLSRCQARKGTPTHGLVTIEVCTETRHHRLYDGFRSFPSGHSSGAFSGLGFFALFLAGQLHVFRPGADLARLLLVMVPLIGALLIAVSRCEDYRHDVYDVTIGSLLGLLIAHMTYRRFYPNLRHPQCHIPYPKRSEMTRNPSMAKPSDEERGPSLDAFEFDDSEAESAPLQDPHRDRVRR